MTSANRKKMKELKKQKEELETQIATQKDSYVARKRQEKNYAYNLERARIALELEEELVALTKKHKQNYAKSKEYGEFLVKKQEWMSEPVLTAFKDKINEIIDQHDSNLERLPEIEAFLVKNKVNMVDLAKKID